MHCSDGQRVCHRAGPPGSLPLSLCLSDVSSLPLSPPSFSSLPLALGFEVHTAHAGIADV